MVKKGEKIRERKGIAEESNTEGERKRERGEREERKDGNIKGGRREILAKYGRENKGVKGYKGGK